MLERGSSRRSNSSYSFVRRPRLGTQTEQHYFEILYTLHQEVQSLKLLAESKTKEVESLIDEREVLSKRHRAMATTLKQKDAEILKYSKISMPSAPLQEVEEFQPLTFTKKPPSNSIPTKLRKKIYR